jgi:hypothetical protein
MENAVTVPGNDATFRIVTSWTNGRKAMVYLMQNATGQRVILKIYRPGFFLTMCREYLVTKYIGLSLSGVPRVLAFAPFERKLVLSFLTGQRVLEWVLQRFGDPGLPLEQFQSFHGLDPDNLNPDVATAFDRFRQSTSAEAQRLRRAMRSSYEELHRIRMLHGSPDPRNVIYQDGRIFIIDFDHARPAWNPSEIDGKALEYWYRVGLAQADGAGRGGDPV